MYGGSEYDDGSGAADKEQHRVHVERLRSEVLVFCGTVHKGKDYGRGQAKYSICYLNSRNNSY